MSIRHLPAVAIFAVIACSPSKPGGRTQKAVDELVIGMDQEPDSLWPALSSMMAGTEIKAHIGVNPTTGMTVVDDEWKVRPNLAGYRAAPGAEFVVPSLENGGMEDLCTAYPPATKDERCGKPLRDMNGKPAKALMVTHWELRADAKWSDGTPVSVADVTFGYSFIMSKDLPVTDRTMEEKIAWIGPVTLADGSLSTTRFDIFWKELYAYNQTGSLTILPRHILYEPFTYNPGRLKEHWFGRKPIGWGPWKIEEYRRGSHIILVPNEHYWVYKTRKPHLSRLTYRFIRNTNSLKAALEANSLDATSETGLKLDDLVKLEKRYKDRWNYHYRSGLVWEHIDLRIDTDAELHEGKPNPLGDIRVRKALLLSANRQQLADALLEGKVKVAHSYLPALHYAYHEGQTKYPFDPIKAGKLLDEAGWKMGSDGIRKKGGERLHLEFGTTAENKIRELVQQVLQQDWQNVGIEVEMKNEPPSVFFGQTTHKRKFKHMAMYAWLLSPVAAGDGLWRSDMIPSKLNNWQGQNMAGLRNDEITELTIEAEKTLDIVKRTAIIKRVQEIYADQLPAIPLYFRVNTSVTSKRIRGWRPTGTQIPISWNSHEWRLEN
jgi:peptide/nickel transport system substrate-binding protein